MRPYLLNFYNANGPDLAIPRATIQSFVIALESLTSLANTMKKIGQEHLLDKICFESLTTLSVECFFKGMRADHDMPTVTNYAYRRAHCVQDGMLRIYQGEFSVLFYRAKLVLSREDNQG